MAYVTEFDSDIFVSYAHIDNKATDWVTSLASAIKDLVSERVGSEVVLWRDERLLGNEFFDDLLKRRVQRSAVFLAVVSPRYVQSSSCLKECQAFAAGPKLRIADTSRLVRARRRPLQDGLAEPPELSADRTLGFAFFDKTDAGIEEFDNRSPMPSYGRFWETAVKVADAIAKTLDMLRRDPRPQNPKHTVFLADASQSLRGAREELKRELLGRGHAVVPEKPLFVDGVFNKAAARVALSATSVSIHVFGDAYGAVPEGEQKSVLELEHDLAAEQKLRQLVWIAPESSAATESKLTALLQKVSSGAESMNPAIEICKTSLEAFKEIMLDEVAKNQAPQAATTECKSIYLVCHDADLESSDLQLLRKYLLDAGYPVNLPVFEAPAEELRVLEEQSFIENDATVIYYERAQDTWVEQKRKFLLSALGRNQQGARARRAVWLQPPTTKSKQLRFGDFAGGKELPEAKGFSPLFVAGDFAPFSSDKLRPLMEWLAK